ncbi:MAG: hypothetical protein K6B40_07165, partial [Firmicutes bacterium]|nr:hypothetical protein [Bacillota bacterium]
LFFSPYVASQKKKWDYPTCQKRLLTSAYHKFYEKANTFIQKIEFGDKNFHGCRGRRFGMGDDVRAAEGFFAANRQGLFFLRRIGVCEKA